MIGQTVSHFKILLNLGHGGMGVLCMAEVGDYEAAINAIERLISLPGALTNASLRLDPIYDPLRDNPRFQPL